MMIVYIAVPVTLAVIGGASVLIYKMIKKSN